MTIIILDGNFWLFSGGLSMGLFSVMVCTLIACYILGAQISLLTVSFSLAWHFCIFSFVVFLSLSQRYPRQLSQVGLFFVPASH